MDGDPGEGIYRAMIEDEDGMPLLGIVGLKARDLIGFSFLQFAVHLPMVLFLLWLLGLSLTYHPPVMPTPS